MTRNEKILYHQIHPAKLATDLAAAIASLVLFSRHQIIWALLVAFAPPIAASWLIMSRADIEKLRTSRFGRYVDRFMTPSAQFRRLLGFALMAYGAWSRSLFWEALGAAFIIHAWTQGLLVPRSIRRSPQRR